MLKRCMMLLAAASAISLPVMIHAQLIPLPNLELPNLIPGVTGGATEMPTYTFQGPIEKKYAYTGPFATSILEHTDVCDREGNTCAIYYPTRLGYDALTGQPGFKHPVIAVAGGTTQSTTENPQPPQDIARYEQFLRHLASWGFIVILTRDGWTSTGETVSDAAEHLVQLNATPGNRFYRKVDVDNMGMTGFSQGGGSVAAQLAQQNPLFKTYLSGQGVGQIFGNIVLTALFPDNPMSTGLLSLANIDKGSIFYVGSTTDSFVSGLDVNLTYYLTTSNKIDKVMGVLNGYPHETVLGNPGCATADECARNPYRGLSVAWFLGKLRGVEDAQSIFRQGGEFAKSELSNPDWTMRLSNIE